MCNLLNTQSNYVSNRWLFLIFGHNCNDWSFYFVPILLLFFKLKTLKNQNNGLINTMGSDTYIWIVYDLYKKNKSNTC